MVGTMDKKIKYSGTTKFYDKETMYDFDGLYLNLYVDNEVYNKLTMSDRGNGVMTSELQKLEFDYLDCAINGTTDKVVFSFGKDISKCSSINFKSFIITLYVHNFIEYKHSGIPSENSDFTMVYYSNDLMSCLHLTPAYNVNLVYEKDKPIAMVELDNSSCEKKSYSNVLGYDIEISPTYRKQWSGCNFDFTPGLQLKIKNGVNIDYNTQFKFYHGFIKLLKYIFMRDNMMPDNFNFKYFTVQGNMYSNYYDNVQSESENANEIYSSYIYWNHFYPVAANIFKAIIENSILLNNIPKTRNDRIMINDVSISKDAAEFEYEFKIAYPNGVPHSEQRVAIENEVKNELNILKDNATGKKKDYYKQFIKHVKQESLKGNMQYMFDEYALILESFYKKLRLELSFDEISSECAGIRNTINHGKKDREITSTTAGCYVLLRALIYSMQLKRFGLDDEYIKASLFDLYRIKQLGSLMF